MVSNTIRLVDILDAKEQIQEDLICILEDSVCQAMLDNACQCVVDRMNELIEKLR